MKLALSTFRWLWLLAVALITLQAQNTQRYPMTVLVHDDGGYPLPGATVEISGDLIIDPERSQNRNYFLSQVTGPDGATVFFTLYPFGFRFKFRIRADGFDDLLTFYEPSRSNSFAMNGILVPKTFIARMQKASGPLVTVNVSSKALGPMGGVPVQIWGGGSSYERNTDAAGVAKIRVAQPGDYEVSVSVERFETWRKTERITDGKEINVQLEPKPDLNTGPDRQQSRISVTITSGGKPLRGAQVSASGSSVETTDAQGRATLGGNHSIGDRVVVRAQAEGHKSGEALAIMEVTGMNSRYSAAKVAINLVPGEDPVDPATPIRLLVSVKVNKTLVIPGAAVKLTFENGRIMTASAAEDGTALFNIEDSAATPLDTVRRGIALEVSATDFHPTLQTIPGSMLKPSKAEVEYEVTLKRDFGPMLRTAMDSLRKQVSELRQSASFYLVNHQQLAAKAKQASATRQSALGLKQAIGGVGQALNDAKLICDSSTSPSGLMNPVFIALARATGQADALLQDLTTKLKEAEQLVQRCDVLDGAAAKRRHTEALQAMANLEKLNRSVATQNEALKKSAEKVKAGKELFDAAQKRLAEFEPLVKTVQEAEGEAETLRSDAQGGYAKATELLPSVRGGIANLRKQLQYFATQGGLDPALAGIPKELDAFEKTATQVAGQIAGGGRAALAGFANTIKAELVTIERTKRETEAELDKLKPGISCSIDPRDNVRKSVEETVEAGLNELLLSADLPAKAQQCELRTGQCARDAEDIRLLMDNGGIEEAEKRIAVAKQRGCQVADLEGELTTARDIRDAATYIHALNQACRFQDAVNWAAQLPAFAKEADLVTRVMRESNAGLAAQNAVNRSLQQAAAAAQVRDAAGAQAALNRAQFEASRYACLLAEVDRQRAGLKLPAAGTNTTSSTKPPVSGGVLTGQATVTPKKRENGVAGSWREWRYSATTIDYEVDIPQYLNTGYQSHAETHYGFNGVPASLTPGNEYTIKLTGYNRYTPAKSGDGLVFGSSITVEGDATIKGQGAHRGSKEYEYEDGEYILTVKPNAKSVVLHLNAANAGEIVWTYKN